MKAIEKVDIQQSARSWLAAQTNVIHDALHHHPLLGRLIAPDVTNTSYLAALAVFHRAYSDVEAARVTLGADAAFSLSPAIAALEADLVGAPVPARATPDCWTTPAAILGALYTCHGAMFGGLVIGRNIAMALPNAPRSYFGRKTNPDLWRALVTRLNTVTEPAEQIEMRQGAQSAFEHVRDLADAAMSAEPDS